MGLKKWIINKFLKEEIKKAAAVTDKMRENSLLSRQLEAAMRAKEKQIELLERIADIEHKTNPKESITDTLFKQALPILLQKMGSQQSPTTSSPQAVQIPQIKDNPSGQQEVSFTKEEIKKFVAVNPKLKTYGRNFSDEDIRNYLINQMPNISKKAIEDIIVEVKS